MEKFLIKGIIYAKFCNAFPHLRLHFFFQHFNSSFLSGFKDPFSIKARRRNKFCFLWFLSNGWKLKHRGVARGPSALRKKSKKCPQSKKNAFFCALRKMRQLRHPSYASLTQVKKGCTILGYLNKVMEY